MALLKLHVLVDLVDFFSYLPGGVRFILVLNVVELVLKLLLQYLIDFDFLNVLLDMCLASYFANTFLVFGELIVQVLDLFVFVFKLTGHILDFVFFLCKFLLQLLDVLLERGHIRR